MMKKLVSVIVSFVVVAAVAGSASAANSTWTNTGTGDWSEGTNWGGSVPPAANGIIINNGGTCQVSTVINTGGATMLIGQSGSNTGTLEILDGGSLTYNSAVTLGNLATNTGNLIVNEGGTFTVTPTAGNFLVGNAGVGNLTIDGTFTCNMSLAISYNAAAGITSTMTVNDGANVNLGNNFLIGRQNAGTGVFELNGGTVTVSPDWVTYIGYTGSAKGEVYLNGGTFNAGKKVVVGWNVGNAGSKMVIDGGALTSGVDGVLVANVGRCTLTMNSGSITTAGAVIVGVNTTAAGYAGGEMTLNGGTVTSVGLTVNNLSKLDITSSSVNMNNSGAFLLGETSTFNAVAGTTMKMTSAAGILNAAETSPYNGLNMYMYNYSKNSSNVDGLSNLSLVIAGGASSVFGGIEVAGADLGADEAGFENNFALANLTVGYQGIVGNVKLIDLTDNTTGIEALYVDNLTVTAGSTIDLNGLNLYYRTGTIDALANFLNGTPISLEQAATPLLGDANGDGVVSADDYAAVQANFGATGEAGLLGDANHDGVVSADDYASVQANFGNVQQAEGGLMDMHTVPEPATMSILALGALAFIRRRK